MEEMTIKRHTFEVAKNRLKEFSEKRADELEISKVETDGGFLWLGDHKVTGAELNRRLEVIQNHFIAVNATNNKVIKEFREIYNALDVLDKDYIASIVANVKAIEKTSNDVRVQQGTLKQHNEKLESQQNKLDVHQTEIEKNVANISKIVKALQRFQEKLEGYKHLTDIDKIWNECKEIQKEIRVVSENITQFSKKTTEDISKANSKSKALADQVNQDILTLRDEAKSFRENFSGLSEKLDSTTELLDKQIPVIREIFSYTEHLKDIKHIDDLDVMWDDVHKVEESVNIIQSKLEGIDSDILKMQKHFDEIDSFIAVLKSYTHLQDIDNIWEDLEVVKANIKKINEGIETHQKELNTLVESNNKNQSAINVMSHKLEDTEEYTVQNRKLITELESFRTEVSSLNHLMQVDEIWNQVEEQQIHINKLEQECKLHTNKLDELTDTIQKNKNEAEEKLTTTIQEANNKIESLTTKIRYVSWIAGGAAGLAIIELILLLL